ncbi:hypothetical protein N7G274_000145 [Stereocaulon virgatum]|uniref:Uncharacterized protein n=1 Tax=Stereocaulon virgatum TaxID=373712 RepID=A0ABR4ARU5_9LECA
MSWFWGKPLSEQYSIRYNGLRTNRQPIYNSQYRIGSSVWSRYDYNTQYHGQTPETYYIKEGRYNHEGVPEYLLRKANGQEVYGRRGRQEQDGWWLASDLKIVPAAQDRPPGYDNVKGKGGYSYRKDDRDGDERGPPPPYRERAS